MFQIIAGERRWRSAQIAGLHRVPAVVRESEEHHTLELALVENLQREGLNPIDEARAYQRLLSEFNLKQEAIAERVGKNRASVANILRLLKLPEKVQEWLLADKLTVGHAKALLALVDDAAMLEVASEIIKEGYSVRQAEALVSRSAGSGKKSREKLPEDPNVRAALVALERALGTKVTIQQSGKGKGKIEIHFHSQAERDRLYNGLVEARF